jgi:hypothetical protein
MVLTTLRNHLRQTGVNRVLRLKRGRPDGQEMKPSGKELRLSLDTRDGAPA